MSNEIHIDQVLDELLKNRLSRSEAERELAKTGVIDMSAEIELHYSAARSIHQFNVLQQVQKVHSEYLLAKLPEIPAHSSPGSKGKLVNFGRVKWILGIAASLLLITSTWFFYQYSTNNAEKLYAELYQPYSLNTSRGLEEPVTHNMVEEFRNQNYAAVIKTFESLPKTNNREKFLSAYSYLQMEQYNQSITNLIQILAYNRQNNTRIYNDEAEFYLALSYLKNNQPAMATPILEGIRSKPAHTFHERVSKWSITRLRWLD